MKLISEICTNQEWSNIKIIQTEEQTKYFEDPLGEKNWIKDAHLNFPISVSNTKEKMNNA